MRPSIPHLRMSKRQQSKDAGGGFMPFLVSASVSPDLEPDFRSSLVRPVRRKISYIAATVKIDMQNLGLPGLNVGQKFAVRAVTSDLKIVFLLTGIVDDKSGSAARHARWHVDSIFVQRYIHVPGAGLRRERVRHGVNSFFRVADRRMRDISGGSRRCVSSVGRFFRNAFSARINETERAQGQD